MAERGPERYGGEGLSMPLYGVAVRRRPRKGRPLLSLLVLLVLIAVGWWVAREVFGVSFAALGAEFDRLVSGLLATGRGLFGT